MFTFHSTSLTESRSELRGWHSSSNRAATLAEMQIAVEMKNKEGGYIDLSSFVWLMIGLQATRKRSTRLNSVSNP
jgi:hypothetical protein